MTKTTVVHFKHDEYDVYIGRPSIWGNPFSHMPSSIARFRAATRDEAIAKHREWIKTQPRLLARLHELKGKRLACWCRCADHWRLPQNACHGDTLAELADALPDDTEPNSEPGSAL